MAAVNILKFSTSSPADTSPLDKLQRAGHSAADVVAVVGKTEGNGCVNDFSRTLAAAAWAPLVPGAITVFSGGTEGVLSPHATLVVRDRTRTTGALMAAAGHTERIEPADVGTARQARQVAAAVDEAVGSIAAGARVAKEDVQVHLVLVKCPLLTSTQIEALRRQSGVVVQTADTYESMAISRRASAAGVALALGEHPTTQGPGSKMADDLIGNVECTRASCSSGAELDNCHILVLASKRTERLTGMTETKGQPGELRALSGVMADAIDAKSVMALLKQVEADNGEVVQVFAKAEADPRGHVRGQRHTMNTDSDIHSTRHARAAVGGLLAGLVGDTELYVSGGAEGQGPSGGGSLCIVYRCRDAALDGNSGTVV
jgi:cyanuric acid amidohydrolase